MSAEFIVEKDHFGKRFTVTNTLRTAIQNAIDAAPAPNKDEGNPDAGKSPNMVFALVVDEKANVHLLCGAGTKTGNPATPFYTVWNSRGYEGKENERIPFPTGAKASILHPQEDDILIVEYPTHDPSDAYIGFCTYILGVPRWF